MFYIGCHLSVSDGYEAMGQTALKLGANTFQYFTRNPRGGSKKIPDESDVAALMYLMKENRFGPIVAHAPYVYNPASVEPEKQKFARECMKEDIEVLERMPGTLYNFHPGCHVGQGSETGVRQAASLLTELLSGCSSTVILIETMAGKGSEIGRSFEEIRQMLDMVPAQYHTHVGVCLDTCHVHDGGYPVATDPSAVWKEFDRVIGLSYLKAIHLNDSKNPMGAAKDRHEKIGQGAIGAEGIRRIILSPELAELPFCLETPCDLDGYRDEIALLRSWRQN